MAVESADGKFKYTIAGEDRYINLLKQVYGERVHMPFGYFRAGTARVKFFSYPFFSFPCPEGTVGSTWRTREALTMILHLIFPKIVNTGSTI